ncbi:MAG: hypothetical protein ACHQQS_02875 [Thermoanaerobaculales bacterium]
MLLVNGASNRDVSRNVPELSRMAVYRHRAHIPAGLVPAHRAEEVSRADDLLDQVRDLQERAIGILAKAETAGDLRAATGAIREARGCLELLGKLAGELQDGVTVNVLVAPEWLVLRGRILTALQPYPEARLALARVVDDGNQPSS